MLYSYITHTMSEK